MIMTKPIKWAISQKKNSHKYMIAIKIFSISFYFELISSFVAQVTFCVDSTPVV